VDNFPLDGQLQQSFYARLHDNAIPRSKAEKPGWPSHTLVNAALHVDQGAGSWIDAVTGDEV
jgi:hypothetical protein